MQSKETEETKCQCQKNLTHLMSKICKPQRFRIKLLSCLKEGMCVADLTLMLMHTQTHTVENAMVTDTIPRVDVLGYPNRMKQTSSNQAEE